MEETPDSPARIRRLGRRLGALLYDAVLLFGALLLAILLLIAPYDLISSRPYPHGEPLYRTLMQVYLLAVILGFYVYFWTHGGQTLGLRTWRMRVERADGRPMNTGDALSRLGWAALSLVPSLIWLGLMAGRLPTWLHEGLGLLLAGLSLWWSLLDRDGLAWHERMSGTRLVSIEAPKDLSKG